MIDTVRLKAFIAQKGWTQKKLSRVVGVRENTISDIVNGKSQPKADTITMIAIALEVDVKDLYVIPEAEIYASMAFDNLLVLFEEIKNDTEVPTDVKVKVMADAIYKTIGPLRR